MNIHIHKYIVLKGFVSYKSLVCIKVLQIIVIFPESHQAFSWGESENPGGGGGREEGELLM